MLLGGEPAAACSAAGRGGDEAMPPPSPMPALRGSPVASTSCSTVHLGVSGGSVDTKKRRHRSGPKSKHSPYIGVSQYKRTGRWEAHIWQGQAELGDAATGAGAQAAAASSSAGGGHKGKAAKGKQLHLGSFATAALAARVYDRAALLMRGPEAELNFVRDHYADDALMQQLRGLPTQDVVMALRKSAAQQEGGGSGGGALGPLLTHIETSMPAASPQLQTALHSFQQLQAAMRVGHADTMAQANSLAAALPLPLPLLGPHLQQHPHAGFAAAGTQPALPLLLAGAPLVLPSAVVSRPAPAVDGRPLPPSQQQAAGTPPGMVPVGGTPPPAAAAEAAAGNQPTQLQHAPDGQQRPPLLPSAPCYAPLPDAGDRDPLLGPAGPASTGAALLAAPPALSLPKAPPPFRLDSSAEFEALLNSLYSPAATSAGGGIHQGGSLSADRSAGDAFQLRSPQALREVASAGPGGAGAASGDPAASPPAAQPPGRHANIAGAGGRQVAAAGPAAAALGAEVPGAFVRLVSGIAEELKAAAADAQASQAAGYSWLVALTK